MREIIDHKTIVMPFNYALIKPDLDLTKFHIDGKESFLHVGTSAMVYLDESSIDFTRQETMLNDADHWSITGEVICPPKRIGYFGKELQRIHKNAENGLTDEEVKKLVEISQDTVQFDTDIEIIKGDKVIFDSGVHVDCEEFGKQIDTDIGILYMVKYDRLRGYIREGEITPINGLVFFNWIQPEEIKFGNLILSASKKDIWDVGKKDLLVGEVRSFGSVIRGEINGSIASDFHMDKIKPGDKFYFKGIKANNVENQGHFHIFGGDEVYMIRQTDILGLVV